MDAFTDLTQGFLSMSETGGEILLGWMAMILPMVVCLMMAVSTVVRLIRESRVERITKFLTRWRIACYTLLPLTAILFLGNPLYFTFGKLLDEKYKTAYYDACVSFLCPVMGLLPYTNVAELSVYMGIAPGITQQKLSLSALATCYFMARLVIMVLHGTITEQISVYLSQKKEGQKPTEEAVAEEKKNALKQQQAVRVIKGSAGWGGPFLLQVDKRKHVILCVSGGGIHPTAQRLAEACQCDVTDEFAVSYPDEEILVVVTDCDGTARCGIYSKKGISTINVPPTGQSGPLACFMKEDNYVSDMGEANIKILNKDTVPTTDPMQEPESETSVQPASHKNMLLRVGMGTSRVVSTCYAAGKETIGMVLRNILPFVAFIITLLGMIQVSGLGNFIVNSIVPLCAALPGMLLTSLICSLPVISPILGPGTVIARVVGALLGMQIILGNIPTQHTLPVLFAINAQAGCDFIPAGLSLCQARAETVEASVPAVLYSRMISGPPAVFITYFFSIGMYQGRERAMMKYDIGINGWGECALEFLNEDCNFLTTFNETVPQELADISVLYTVAMLQEESCVGDTVQICDISYTITVISLEALHTLKEFGHCCLSLSGGTQTLCPGNIELKGPVFTENHFYKGGRLQILQKIILDFKESANNWYMFRLSFHMGLDKDVKQFDSI